jgi:hypothetical protein
MSSASSWSVLAISPPYRAAPGRPVYVLHASDRAVLMGEDNLIGRCSIWGPRSWQQAIQAEGLM